MSDATAAETYDAEFFIDTACPWCWITSRWVTNVQAERNLTVRWRFISLKFLNEDKLDGYAVQHRDGHLAALKILRVLDEVRARKGNDAVGAAYTAIGTALHNHGRIGDALADMDAFLSECLVTAGLDAAYVSHAEDESHDSPLRAETELALSRTGPDVGTPIITFNPDTEVERSVFGPVIPKAPKGEDAVVLWDAVLTLANSGVAEIKRTLRGDISFD